MSEPRKEKYELNGQTFDWPENVPPPCSINIPVNFFTIDDGQSVPKELISDAIFEVPAEPEELIYIKLKAPPTSFEKEWNDYLELAAENFTPLKGKLTLKDMIERNGLIPELQGIDLEQPQTSIRDMIIGSLEQ